MILLIRDRIALESKVVESGNNILIGIDLWSHWYCYFINMIHFITNIQLTLIAMCYTNWLIVAFDSFHQLLISPLAVDWLWLPRQLDAVKLLFHQLLIVVFPHCVSVPLAVSWLPCWSDAVKLLSRQWMIVVMFACLPSQ